MSLNVETNNFAGTVIQPEVRVIKRYNNRKLYDTGLSSYITLDDIYNYVNSGNPIQVINNKTKADITTPVILNALAERGKNVDNGTVIGMLDNLANYLRGGQNG